LNYSDPGRNSSSGENNGPELEDVEKIGTRATISEKIHEESRKMWRHEKLVDCQKQMGNFQRENIFYSTIDVIWCKMKPSETLQTESNDLESNSHFFKS
jgi:hypothetical protein